MSPRTFAAAFVLALALLPAGAVTSLADDGRPISGGPAGHPSASTPPTGGRPHAVPFATPTASRQATDSDDPPASHQDGRRLREGSRALVILVGGYATNPADDSFKAIEAQLSKDPDLTVERFGTDPDLPYDSYGPLDASARGLTAKVRREAPSYPGGVHLISHSGGGAVVARAFQDGLSARDGVRTFQAIAAPHSGSIAAKVSEPVMRLLGNARDLVRATVMLLPLPDPESKAMHDLARVRPVPPPRGVVEVDYTLSSDAFVMAPDNRHPGVPARIYTPRSFGETIEGHGGSLVSRELVIDLARTVRCACVLRETRTPSEIAVARYQRFESTKVGFAYLVLAVLFAFLVAFWRNQQPPFVRRLLDRWAKTRLREMGR